MAMRMLVTAVAATMLLVSPVTGFAGLPEVSSFLPHSLTLANGAGELAPSLLLSQYTQSLAVHPLETKMATGAVLATLGDAIAQSKTDEKYDVRRASSFAAFDVAYRALQHVAFPFLVEHCKGQLLLGLTAAVLPSLALTHSPYFAAMEQTLASQLGIVPFLYYPVFFALTGAVQGLTMEKSVERAQESFLPLFKRNLLYWIPVQFIQFGFIPESLQIPFLCMCGLVWTFILSAMAGSTKQYAAAEQQVEILTDENVQLLMDPLANDDDLQNNIMKFDQQAVEPPPEAAEKEMTAIQ